MKIKRTAKSVQQELARALPEQLNRMKGWPVTDGQEKTLMWRPICWPSSGKVPDTVQRLLQR